MTTKKVYPFKRQGQHVVSDVVLDDHVMPKVSGNAYKILRLIVRWTKGENEEWAGLSYFTIRERTGIKSDQTITKSLQELFELGIIIKDDPADNWINLSYALNSDFEIEIPTSENEVATSENEVEAPIYINNNIIKDQPIDNDQRKRKKEKRKTKKVWTDDDIRDLIPDNLNTAEFIFAWECWMDWRADPKPEGKNKPLTKHPTAAKQQLKLCAKYPVAVAVAMVERATGRWESIFALPDFDPVVIANQTSENKPLADAGGQQREALKSA